MVCARDGGSERWRQQTAFSTREHGSHATETVSNEVEGFVLGFECAVLIIVSTASMISRMRDLDRGLYGFNDARVNNLQS